MKIEKLIDLRLSMERVIANYVARMSEEYLEDEKGLNVISPATDTYLDGERQIIFIETPALEEKSVDISRRDGMLVFRGVKKVPSRHNRKYLHMERNTGDYLKLVPLEKGEENIADIEHSYKYGVVKITVTYREAA